MRYAILLLTMIKIVLIAPFHSHRSVNRMLPAVAAKPQNCACLVRPGACFRLRACGGPTHHSPDAQRVNVRGHRLNMANTPKKVKDPTEVALSAIQEALNISDVGADNDRHSADSEVSPSTSSSDAPVYSEAEYDTRANTERPIFDTIDEPRAPRRAANDDRETIGQILQALQKGRPARSVYTLATLFAGVWIAGCVLLTFSFLPALQAAMGQSSGVLVLGGLAALFFAPVLLFYFLASLAWRGQEMRLIAQSMAQVAIRFSEPEGAAADSMVTVGQAIRREVAAMGDGVERAIARAGELETLVANEVAALERAYSDNEVRIRALLQDIAHQRDNLVGQAEQVRSAISGVQIDLRHDIALI